MSKALRCDKCGATFSPLLIGVTDKFTTIPEMHFQTKDDLVHNICYGRKTDINFCPNCTNKFFEFMEDFKNETGYLSAELSLAKSSDDPKCVRGRYKYERSSRNSDCEASEWSDDPK